MCIKSTIMIYLTWVPHKLILINFWSLIQYLTQIQLHIESLSLVNVMLNIIRLSFYRDDNKADSGRGSWSPAPSPDPPHSWNLLFLGWIGNIVENPQMGQLIKCPTYQYADFSQERALMCLYFEGNYFYILC